MAENVFVSDKIVNSNILGKKDIYILSTEINSKIIFFLLLQYQVRVSGFVVREKQDIIVLYSLPVLTYTEIETEEAVYVIDKSRWNEYCDIIDGQKIYYVETDKFLQNKFVFEENGETKKCNAALMITMILSRAKNKQAVFLIKSKDYSFWKNIVAVLENEVKNPIIIQVDLEEDRIYDLMYSDIKNLIIFIALFEFGEISQILTDLGLKQTQNFVHIGNSFTGTVVKNYYGFDWLLGNSFVEKKNNSEKDLYYGFYIHGNLEDHQKKIVLLGNSATDPFFYPQKSWPEMFWEECNKQQISVAIYNGAITDYNSSNEVIKLYRDVLLLKPDIVVSYSGIIDFRQYIPGYPYLNLNLMRTSKKWECDNKKDVIYGLKDERSAYERWLGNEKIMKQICEANGISFYGVLQPWIGSDCGDGCEKLKVWSDYYWQVAFPQFAQYIDNAKEFKRRIQIDVKQNEWLYDFTNIFSEIDDADIFFDSIHVNEMGNQVVARRFCEILVSI